MPDWTKKQERQYRAITRTCAKKCKGRGKKACKTECTRMAAATVNAQKTRKRKSRGLGTIDCGCSALKAAPAK